MCIKKHTWETRRTMVFQQKIGIWWKVDSYWFIKPCMSGIQNQNIDSWSRENPCWLMISSGILLPNSHYRDYNKPKGESRTKPTRIQWNDRGVLNIIEHCSYGFAWSVDRKKFRASLSASLLKHILFGRVSPVFIPICWGLKASSVFECFLHPLVI